MLYRNSFLHQAHHSHPQAALEKNFFHNQPSALQRTVSFLAERLASNIIRKVGRGFHSGDQSVQVRCELVVEERRAAVASLQESLESQALVPELARGSRERVCGAPELYQELETDSKAGLQLLLSSESSPAVREVCGAVTVRTVRERVGQYLAQHVTLAYFTREYRGEAERLVRKAVTQPPPVTTPLLVEHQPSCPPPSASLVQMKLELRQLLVERSHPPLTEPSVLALLTQARTCLTSRSDLTSAATRGLETLSLDYVLALTVHLPEVITEPVLDCAVEMWSTLPPPQLLGLVCPRNLFMMASSPKPSSSWRALEQLLSRLLQASLLPSLALEDSCLALQDTDLDLEALASCLGALAKRVDGLAWVYEVFPSL